MVKAAGVQQQLLSDDAPGASSFAGHSLDHGSGTLSGGKIVLVQYGNRNGVCPFLNTYFDARLIRSRKRFPYVADMGINFS